MAQGEDGAQLAIKLRPKLSPPLFNPGYAFFLLRKKGGGWSVAEISVGPTGDWWRQKYKIPETLFRP